MFRTLIQKSLLHAQLILNWQGGAPAKHVSVVQKGATGLMKRVRIAQEWGRSLGKEGMWPDQSQPGLIPFAGPLESFPAASGQSSGH